MKDLLVAYHRI